MPENETSKDADEVAVIEETDNGLSPEDEANVPQPPQDPDYEPNDDA